MKLRIQGTSIRIRLTQTEVARLAEGQNVAQETPFPGNTVLKASVESDSSAPKIIATMESNHLRIAVPPETLSKWASSDDVGVGTDEPIPGGETLSILIEKDFQCLHRRGNEADAFPNPRG